MGFLGCDPDRTLVEYEPYAGDAYPDRVADVAYPERAAIVTDSLSDTLSVIDLSTGAKVDARPVGRNPVDIDGPHHITIDKARGVGFVALSYPVIDGVGPHATHGGSAIPGYAQKIDLKDLSVMASVRVDPNPGDIVLSQDGSKLVVSHFDRQRATKNPTDINAARATIAVIDPATMGQPQLIKTCVAPHGLALSPDGNTAYVACYGEDRLAIVDLTQPSAQPTLIDVGAGVVGFGAPSYGPYVAVLSPDGAWVIVCDTVSKDVRFFEVATGAFDFTRTITTLGAPYFPAFTADNKLVIPTQQPDGLYIADLADNTNDQNITFATADCYRPHEVVIDQGRTFVVCEGDQVSPGSVTMLDEDYAVVTRTEVGVYPDSLRIVTGGQ
ncbi:MAG: YncE family protein [Polyangiaceae bacterium]|nr:YncE family protein [Polyangiaceae bacterium]